MVRVPSATSLQLIASATDTSVDFIRSLNPELRRDITPRGEAYDVRVPPGRGKNFVALLKRVPSERRETARVVAVAPGEDINAVAARTGVSVAQLQQWNAGVDLKAAGKLVVPAGSVTKVGYFPKRGATLGSSLRSVRARANETIAQIATRHNVSADEVARLNGFTPDTALSSNQEIKVPVSAAAPATTTASPRRRR